MVSYTSTDCISGKSELKTLAHAKKKKKAVTSFAVHRDKNINIQSYTGKWQINK